MIYGETSVRPPHNTKLAVVAEQQIILRAFWVFNPIKIYSIG